MKEKEEDVISDEDIDLIFTGKRPDNMPYEKFRAIRSELNRYTKNRLKGTMFHVSSWPETTTDKETGEKEYTGKVITKTYIKPKEDGV
jgi:hypothetical protein